jgi:hypothetical protein
MTKAHGVSGGGIASNKNVRGTHTVADRVPGDPRYVRRLWNGTLAMPAPVTARARWEVPLARQLGKCQPNTRMTKCILDRMMAEWPGFEDYTLQQFRDAMERIEKEGEDE